MVKTIEHPWIIVLAFIFAILLGRISPKLSVLSLLLLFAFVIEVYLFTRPVIIDTPKEIPTPITGPSPVDILNTQSTSNAIPYNKHDYRHMEEHKGYPLYDVLLPTPLYPLFDTIYNEPNMGLINGGITN